MANNRLWILILVAFIGLSAIVIRLVKIQIIDHDDLAFKAEKQQIASVNVKAERGVINDRNGEALCFTKDDVSFIVDSKMAKKNEKSLDRIANKFSEIFGKEKSYYVNLINGSDKNICIEKKADHDKALLLKDFVADELKKVPDYTRIYPYGNLAAHILGYVDENCKGVYGIEKSLDKQLTGKDGKLLVDKDVFGKTVAVNEDESTQSYEGNTIYLTINRSYQQILEKELKNGLDNYGGSSAVGIIIDPNTGEILAMANNPSFDPNDFSKYTDEERRNRIITDPYEPGSTFKSVTMSMLLDNGLVQDDEVINTENGTWKLQHASITDAHKSSKLTVKEILEFSSNIGMAKLSERIDKKLFYKYLRDFGFGNATSIELPGEANGMLKLPDAFSQYSKMYMSFGYEIMVTPLQMAMAFSALVNGGNLMKPILISKAVDQQGKVVVENKPVVLRRVIKEATSGKIKEYMIGVVENGTGKNARLNNVLVGGKTGSTRKLVENKYSKGQHYSSFIGFFPANAPKILCMIMVSSPEIGKDGGLVAAPIFHEIARQIIEIDPKVAPDKSNIDRKEETIKSWFADNPKNDGSKYMDVPDNSDKSEKNISKEELSGNTMPNLQGKSVRESIAALNKIGLKSKVIGTGNVIWQSVEPGASFKKGDVCLIKCEPAKKLNKIYIN